MNRDEHDPYNVRPSLERYLSRTFLTRDQWRRGYVFSPFEALICDQYENPWQGVRAAMTVGFVINIAADLHKRFGKPRRR
jgi:hypothetical protein